MSFEEGPYVQVACFCENVLHDVSGPFSLVRIVDTIESSASGPNPPVDMPPVTINLKMVLMLKSGTALGRHEIKIQPQLPTKETKEPHYYTTHLEGEEKGHNFIIDFSFTLEQEGTYWFNIFFDEAKLTAIPLRSKYSRQITSSPVRNQHN